MSGLNKGETINRKYEFTGDTKEVFGVTLKRIRALVTIAGVVTAGDTGGWIESESNFSPDAQVSGNAWVYGNARVSGGARVYGNAQVYGNARVYGNAWVYGNARVSGNARVYGNAQVYGNAWVYGNARVSGNAEVSGNAQVSGDARVYGNAQVSGDARVYGKEAICSFSGFGSTYRQTTAYADEKIGIRVACGCFTGSLEEFRAQVIRTHGEDSKNGKLYLGMANMIEYRLSKEDQCSPA